MTILFAHCHACLRLCDSSWFGPTVPPSICLLPTRLSDLRRRQSLPSPLQEIAPKQSGITWVHNNAHSPERHLPETVGAGCAFFDYDNDGWMDIYLVNSGPADFFTPTSPLRNALYHNNHDGTFTDVTDKAGVAGGTFGMGVAAGRL